MNTKEKRQEEQELQKAVSVLRATLRSIANRKACRYEQEFLHRVRASHRMEGICQEVQNYKVAICR